MRKKILLFITCLIITACSRQQTAEVHTFTRVWSAYRTAETIEKDFADLKVQGIAFINVHARETGEAKEKLKK